MFTYSYRNTSGSLGEREIEVGTRNFEKDRFFNGYSSLISFVNTNILSSFYFYLQEQRVRCHQLLYLLFQL